MTHSLSEFFIGYTFVLSRSSREIIESPYEITSFIKFSDNISACSSIVSIVPSDGFWEIFIFPISKSSGLSFSCGPTGIGRDCQNSIAIFCISGVIFSVPVSRFSKAISSFPKPIVLSQRIISSIVLWKSTEDERT